MSIFRKKLELLLKKVKDHVYQDYDIFSELNCRKVIDFEIINKKKIKAEHLEATLIKGCDVLEKLGVKYSLGRGSVLGFYRDNSFLPNDIDIDIDVFSDADIYKIIKEMPFDVFLIASSEGYSMQLAMLDRETDVIFDIWFYHRNGSKFIIRNYHGYFWMPTEKVETFAKINYNGRDYPSPDPEWFCNFWYGENWRTPVKYQKNWEVDYQRDCNGFVYTGPKQIRWINAKK